MVVAVENDPLEVTCLGLHDSRQVRGWRSVPCHHRPLDQPFTGNVIQNAREIDIDHLVPLNWAWKRGAYQWSDDRRETFANDPINLWPVELGLNRSKGERAPNQWLPPAGQCQYVARFSRVVKQYDLQPTSEERGWLKNFLEKCRR